MKNTMNLTQRILSAAVLLASVLTLLFGTCVTFRSWSAFSEEIEGTLSMAASFGGWMGLDIDAAGVRKASRALTDGKISGSEAYTVARETGKVTGELLKLGWDEDLSNVRSMCNLYEMLSLCTFGCAVAGLANYLAGGRKQIAPYLYAVLVLMQVIIFGMLGDGVKYGAAPFLSLAFACLTPAMPLLTERNRTAGAAHDNQVDAASTAARAKPAVDSDAGIRTRLEQGVKSRTKTAAERVNRASESLKGWAVARKASGSTSLKTAAKSPCPSDAGAEAPILCRHCGHRLSEEARFCGWCGADLREGSSAAEHAPVPAGESAGTEISGSQSEPRHHAGFSVPTELD